MRPQFMEYIAHDSPSMELVVRQDAGHAVEFLGQLAGLIGGMDGQLDTVVAGRQAVGGGRHGADRPQQGAGDPPGQGGGEKQADEGDHQAGADLALLEAAVPGACCRRPGGQGQSGDHPGLPIDGAQPGLGGELAQDEPLYLHTMSGERR